MVFRIVKATGVPGESREQPFGALPFSNCHRIREKKTEGGNQSDPARIQPFSGI
jgi:hypothetical protein